MKFWVLLIFLGILLSTITFGQTSNPVYPHVVQKGDFLISPGISIGHRKTNNYFNSNRTGVIPEISLSVEYALEDELSIGPIASFYARTYKYEDTLEVYTFNAHRYFVGARASYHFGKFLERNLFTDLNSEFLDIYITFGAGYKGTYFINDRQRLSNSGKITGIALGGLRYMFFEKIGLFAEGGLGPFAVFMFGLTVRL